MNKIDRFKNLLNNINQYNAGEEGITRIAFTHEEQSCTHAFMRLCKNEGLEVRMDHCGNVIARRKGKFDDFPPVAMGSHLDTVYRGGQYDGVIGVAAGLEVIKRLNEHKIQTNHPIELISFACEESARFGVSTIGSKVMAGNTNKNELFGLRDKDGITFAKALSLCALDFNELDLASRRNEKFKAFIELHIEQGPILNSNRKKIGIVTAIAAPIRYHIKIKGKTSHSGTTPMHLRSDAFLGAAEIALEIEEAAKSEKGYGTVATVGTCEVSMGAMNVVPGYSEIKVDIRSSELESRDRVVHKLIKKVNMVQMKRNLQIECCEISNEAPVQLDSDVADNIRVVCEQLNISYQFIQSGAGHDAMNMTNIAPTGLIFIPSVDGLSHHPDEYTSFGDISLGIDVLEAYVIRESMK